MDIDSDFKEQNNYREVECCGNCKQYENIYDNIGIIGTDCKIYSGFGPRYYCSPCDKWEHE